MYAKILVGEHAGKTLFATLENSKKSILVKIKGQVLKFGVDQYQEIDMFGRKEK